MEAGLLIASFPVNGLKRRKRRNQERKVSPKIPSTTLPFGLVMIFLRSEVKAGIKSWIDPSQIYIIKTKI